VVAGTQTSDSVGQTTTDVSSSLAQQHSNIAGASPGISDGKPPSNGNATDVGSVSESKAKEVAKSGNSEVTSANGEINTQLPSNSVLPTTPNESFSVLNSNLDQFRGGLTEEEAAKVVS
jgi:hypothetical protein